MQYRTYVLKVEISKFISEAKTNLRFVAWQIRVCISPTVNVGFLRKWRDVEISLLAQVVK